MQYKWRTSIKPAYKWRCVLRASFFGGIGVIILVAAGSFMPVAQLSIWGLPLLLIAGALITWSMLPYRRMTRLENAPDELWVNSTGDLVYAKQSTPIFTIPRSTIDKVFYIDKPKNYGICIGIKSPTPEKVRVHNPGFNFQAFRKSSIHTYGCDIFLPWFSERTFQELQEYLQEV